MVDPAKDRHVWAESYDRPLKDVFSIQSEISRAVAEELKIRLLPGERAKLETQPTGSTEAYTLYLKGKYYLNERAKDGFRKAIQYFTEASKRDPNFARAYVGLSSCYGIMENWGLVRPEEAYARCKTYTARALELDNNLGEAHVELASLLALKEWKISDAEGEFRRAIKLDQNSSVAHQRLAFSILGPNGRHEEALSELTEAARLDPLSTIIAANIGDELLRANRYEDAEKQYQRILENDPAFWYVHTGLGLALLGQSRFEDAISSMEKAREISSDRAITAPHLILAYWLAGRKDEANKELSQLEKRSEQEYVSNVSLALANAAIDRKDRTIDLLEKAVAEKSNQLRSNVEEQHFDRLRSDPRFQKILETIGIKQKA